MAFSEYKSLAGVVQEFSLRYEEAAFDRLLAPLAPPMLAPQDLHETIRFNLKEMPYDVSEAMIGESLIFPLLREVWKPFRKDLMLWSHTAISHAEPLSGEVLSGVPDYLFAKQSALGKIVLDKPFVAVVEAKKDDFAGGWGQCAIEMVVAQRINASMSETALSQEIFGIVSNGVFWQFASLRQSVFTKYEQIISINDLDPLYTMLTSILTICKEQLT